MIKINSNENIIKSISHFIEQNKTLISVMVVFYFLPLLITNKFIKDPPIRSLLDSISIILIFGIFTLSFEIQLGRTGLLNFGQAVLFGVGAYALFFYFSFIYSINYDLVLQLGPVVVPFGTIFTFLKDPVTALAVGLILGIIAGAILGFIMGLTTNRMRGITFAFIALAIAMVFFTYSSQTVQGVDLFEGGSGKQVCSSTSACHGLDLITSVPFYLLFMVITSIILLAFIVVIYQDIKNRRGIFGISLYKRPLEEFKVSQPKELNSLQKTIKLILYGMLVVNLVLFFLLILVPLIILFIKIFLSVLIFFLTNLLSIFSISISFPDAIFSLSIFSFSISFHKVLEIKDMTGFDFYLIAYLLVYFIISFLIIIILLTKFIPNSPFIRNISKLILFGLLITTISLIFILISIPNIIGMIGVNGYNFFLISPIKYYLVLSCSAGVYLLTRRIIHSPFGRVIAAISQNEQRAQALGYNVYWYKIKSLTLSGAIAGLSGALYAMVIQLLTPDTTFTVNNTINVMLYSIVGGLNTLFGPFLGAGLIISSEATKDSIIGLQSIILDKFNISSNFNPIVIGVIYILIVMFLPFGIAGTFQVKMHNETIPRWLRKIRISTNDYWILSFLSTILIVISLLYFKEILDPLIIVLIPVLFILAIVVVVLLFKKVKDRYMS